MSRLMRNGTAEPISRDQILRRERGHGNSNFPCSAGQEQDWEPYPADPYSALCDDHTYCREATGTGPVAVITMDQLIFASLSHTHYWYEVGMLKVPSMK